VALGLHEPAHHAVGRVQASIVHIRDHRRDDSVVRPLVGRDHVRVALLKIEVHSAVLQHETASLGNDSGAKAFVVGVDEGDGVAFFVGDGEIDGVAVVVGGTAVVVDGWVGFGWIEELGSFGEVFLGEKAGGGHVFDVGVCYPPSSIREGDAEGLDHSMEVWC